MGTVKRAARHVRQIRAGRFAAAFLGARPMVVAVVIAGMVAGTAPGTASVASAAPSAFAAPVASGEKSAEKPGEKSPKNAPGASYAKNEKASDQALVAQIGRQLGQAAGIRTRFVQTQNLAAMKAPLTRTGTLLFVRDQGAIWQIAAPYPATYVMTSAGVAHLGADGRRIDGKNARGIAEVSRLMRALLDGDLSALYSQFDVQAEGTPARWRVRLTPSQPQIAQVIAQLQMDGARTLHTLRIAFRSGDRMQFDFGDTVTVARPTASEAALFNAARR